MDQARKAPLGTTVAFHRDEIVYVSAGDGTTSEGEFYESLNTASNKQLPLLYLIEDNGYAISVPVEVQTAGGNISRLVPNYPHLYLEECDGTDPLESYAVLQRAAEHCRARKGPALVHAHVTRPYSHSLSDDEKLYKCETERSAEAQRDPLPKFAVFLVREGILEESEIEALEAEVDREISRSHRSCPCRRASVAANRFTSGFTRPMSTPASRDFEAVRRKKKAIQRPWWKWSLPHCKMK